MVSSAEKGQLRHKSRHKPGACGQGLSFASALCEATAAADLAQAVDAGDARATIYWQILHTHTAVRTEADRSDARRALAKLSALEFEPPLIAELLHWVCLYVFAVRLRTMQAKAKAGERGKASRVVAAHLAKLCRRLDTSIDRVPVDQDTHVLLADVLLDKRFDGLRANLTAFASEMERAAKKATQPQIALKVRQDALRRMVDLVRREGRRVPWALLASLVNLLGQAETARTGSDETDDPLYINVIAKNLHQEHSLLPR
jgi:hypothetical protein